MGHIATESLPPEAQEATRPVANDRSGPPPASDALREDARWATMPAKQTDPPVFRCDWCHQPVDTHTTGRSVRCACGRRISVPTRVRVRCGRCGFSHWVRAREMQVQRLCANCAQPLMINDLVLPTLRHHHPRHLSGGGGGTSSHGSAVWTMLLLGMALLAAFALFSKL